MAVEIDVYPDSPQGLQQAQAKRQVHINNGRQARVIPGTDFDVFDFRQNLNAPQNIVSESGVVLVIAE